MCCSGASVCSSARLVPGVLVLVLGAWAAGCGGGHSSSVPGTPDGGTPDGGTPDAGMPTLTITSPTPGEEIDGSTSPMITVAGTLTDANPDAQLHLFVDGTEAPLGAGGAFSVDLTPQFGINHIVVEASDDFSPLAQKEMDVMWAPGYLAPNAGTTQFDFSDAILLRIGQRFFDDGLPLDLTPDGMGNVTAQDLADILQLVLLDADLGSLVTNPVISSSALSLSVTGVTVGNVGVAVDLYDPPGTDDAGLNLSLDIRDATIDTSGWANLGGNCTAGVGPDCKSLDGTITTRVLVNASIELSRDPMSGAYTAQTTNFTVDLLNPANNGGCTNRICGTFTDPDVQAVFAVASSGLYSEIQSLVQDQLVGQLTNLLPSLLGDLLLQIDGALADLSFTLDTGLGNPITVDLQSQITSLETVPGSLGYLTAHFDASVGTPNTPVHPASLGAPQADTMPMPPFTTLGRLQLAVRQDMINGLLHSLWNSGMLDLQVSLGSVTADVSAKLPPVVRDTPLGAPCYVDGQPCDVVLQIGQLELDALGQRFGINAEAGARIELSGGRVSLAIQATPTVTVWPLSDTSGTVTPELIQQLVTTTVWPMLFDSLGSSLSFPLPLPALSDLGIGTIAPALSSATLDLSASQRIDVQSGYLGLVADLSLTAPAP